jgi:adenine-specific DNA-methyltransferase
VSYIDPPFATGADFSFTTEIGERGEEITKEQSIIEEKAYRDTWGRGIDSYLSMIYSRLFLMRDLLAPEGIIYVHCDSRVNYLMRAILDEVFGQANLRNEIIWCYRGGGTSEKDSAEKHDVILRYSKGPSYYFDVDPVRIPYSDASTERLQNKANVFRGDKVYRNYEPNQLGKHPEDWWTIQPIMPSEKQERSVCYYPTQKPVELLQRIVESSCPSNGIVLDAFCGSGTTLAVAEGLRVVRGEKNEKSLGIANHRRRWIGCDLGRFAIHTARKRLLSIDNCRPFEVLTRENRRRTFTERGRAFCYVRFRQHSASARLNACTRSELILPSRTASR